MNNSRKYKRFKSVKKGNKALNTIQKILQMFCFIEL